MKLNAIGNLDFDVRARTETDSALLQLRLGPLMFNMTESEGLRLANRIADAVERHRRHRDESAGR